MCIEAVCISEKKGVPKSQVGEAVFETDHGIAGDAHAGPGKRQVSLLSVAAVDRLLRQGHVVRPGEFAENLLVRGADFSVIKVGDGIKVGPVMLEVTQIGKECHDKCAVRERIGICVMPKEGVFAKVVRGGTVKAGDPVSVMPAIASPAERAGA